VTLGALVSVEVRRFLARRLVWVITGLAVLAILVSGTVAFARSHRLQPGDPSPGEIQRQQEIEFCAAGHYGIPPEEVPEGMTLEEFCEQQLVPPAEAFGGDPAFHLSSLQDIYLGTGAVLAMMAWVLAGSFIGAEWRAGTVGTMLTWEPRRIRVILVKAAVAALMAFVGTVLLQALLGAALVPAAVFRGSTEGTTAVWLGDTAGVVLRSAAVSAVAAGLGFSLASVARNTAAAFGVAFGYLIVFEQLLAGLRPGWQKWLLVINVGVFLSGRSEDVGVFGRSAFGAGMVLAAYALGLVLLATALFRVRDVT
jgi:ABC-2 type transport system permease protein